MQNVINRLKTLNRWALIGAVVVIVAIVAIFASGALTPAQSVQAGPPTVKVTTGDLSGTVAISGQLTPRRDVSLPMAAPGIVKEVRVAEGDTVKEGDVLVRLDDEIARQNVDKAELGLQQAEVKLDYAQHDYDNKVTWTPNQNQVNAAEANLKNAQAAVQAAQADYDKVAWLPWISSTHQSMTLQQATNNYDRARADFDYLFSNSPDTIFARDNLQSAKLALNTAQIDFQIAKDTLDNLTLTAPFDGTITAVNVDVGEAASGPIIRMATMNHMEVVMQVDEVDLSVLKVGQPAVATFDAWPGQQVTGKVISVAPSASPAAGIANFEVHIALSKTDLDLRAGMIADVLVTTFSLKDALILPWDAVEVDSQTGAASVMLVTPDGLKKTEVLLGKHNDDDVQILGGAEDGDEVIANP